MMKHLVGHIVGHCHQFPEELYNAHLNTKVLREKYMARIEMELKQRHQPIKQDSLDVIADEAV